MARGHGFIGEDYHSSPAFVKTARANWRDSSLVKGLPQFRFPRAILVRVCLKRSRASCVDMALLEMMAITTVSPL